MSKKLKCAVCSLYGVENEKDISRELLFKDEGEDFPVLLCRQHSVELFKQGQKRFCIHHFETANQIVVAENSTFLNFILEIAKKNKGKIF